jgi:hypothetical protein
VTAGEGEASRGRKRIGERRARAPESKFQRRVQSLAAGECRSHEDGMRTAGASDQGQDRQGGDRHEHERTAEVGDHGEYTGAEGSGLSVQRGGDCAIERHDPFVAGNILGELGEEEDARREYS